VLVTGEDLGTCFMASAAVAQLSQEDEQQQKKGRAETNAVRGPLVLVLVLRRGTGGRWKDEKTGMEEDAQEPGSGGASVVASKSCGQSDVGQFSPKFSR
jgi:hypothetical protein